MRKNMAWHHNSMCYWYSRVVGYYLILLLKKAQCHGDENMAWHRKTPISSWGCTGYGEVLASEVNPDLSKTSKIKNPAKKCPKKCNHISRENTPA
jgi:hypothetical protein